MNAISHKLTMVCSPSYWGIWSRATGFSKEPIWENSSCKISKIAYNIFFRIERVILVMMPGGKLIDKDSDAVYIIQSIHQENVCLVSEDGEVSMLLHKDSIVPSGFEPVHE